MRVRILCLLGLVALLPTRPAPAQAVVELVLLVDATGSIDKAEIGFERRGYASAITARM